MAELLHARHAAHPASIALLARWLSEQRAGGVDTDSARRRLESDAGAIAVHTIHGAKGLEFPVVLLPSLWEAAWFDADAPPLFHDENGQRCIGVGGTGALHDEQRARAEREQAEEELRLLYVALTRAPHQVVLWWATANDTRNSPLARVLLGRDPDTGEVPARLGRLPSEHHIRDAATAIGIAVEHVTARDRARFEPPQPPAGTALSVSQSGLGFAVLA